MISHRTDRRVLHSSWVLKCVELVERFESPNESWSARRMHGRGSDAIFRIL